jgi:hypothetical protein
MRAKREIVAARARAETGARPVIKAAQGRPETRAEMVMPPHAPLESIATQIPTTEE